jgi:hypothetical protein
LLENSAVVRSRLVAATVRARSAAPGVLTVWLSYLLPAEITNSAPVDAVSVLTACDIGSVPSVGMPPRLMLTTLALAIRVAQSMPAMIPDS